MTIPGQLDKIKGYVQKNGQSINVGPEGGWEFQGIRAMIADGGYSVQVVTDELSVWGEHGSGRSGFFRGDETVLAALLEKLNIPS